jgi:heptaprenyl diphosphate synthase
LKILQQAAVRKFKHENNPFKELTAKWDIPDVYALISQEIGGQSGLLGEVCRYLLSSPGKGIRPLLVLISSGFGSLEKSSSIKLAAAMEMLHMAMLVHDDVLDCSKLRRGIPSINSRFNDNTAILTGDYLFGKGLGLVSQFGKDAVERFADIITQSVAGEFKQAERIFNPYVEIKEYYDIICQKTAIFMATCCAVGGLASGSRDETVANLECVGRNLGMAFQIKDDVADWSTVEKDLGKPVVHDLRQGVLTLPVLLVLKISSKKEKIKNVILSRDISDRELSFIQQEIKVTGCLEMCLQTAAGYIEKALDLLVVLPDKPARQDLDMLLNNILAF